MTDAARQSRPISILVVHGIGAQEPGESVGRLMAGLARVEPGLASSALDGAITIGGQPMRLYEVYWADLLKDEIARGAFQMAEGTARRVDVAEDVAHVLVEDAVDRGERGGAACFAALHIDWPWSSSCREPLAPLTSWARKPAP